MVEAPLVGELYRLQEEPPVLTLHDCSEVGRSVQVHSIASDRSLPWIVHDLKKAFKFFLTLIIEAYRVVVGASFRWCVGRRWNGEHVRKSWGVSANNVLMDSEQYILNLGNHIVWSDHKQWYTRTYQKDSISVFKIKPFVSCVTHSGELKRIARSLRYARGANSARRWAKVVVVTRARLRFRLKCLVGR